MRPPPPQLSKEGISDVLVRGSIISVLGALSVTLRIPRQLPTPHPDFTNSSFFLCNTSYECSKSPIFAVNWGTDFRARSSHYTSAAHRQILYLRHVCLIIGKDLVRPFPLELSRIRVYLSTLPVVPIRLLRNDPVVSY